MYSTVKTALVCGIKTIPVRVEVDISNGLPAFDMVGYLSSEVREAKDRVRTALRNCGIILPAKRITVNLSPANMRKTGTGFDLPIAVALLAAMEIIPEAGLEDIVFSGELNLSGQILPISGILPIVSDSVENNIKKFMIPAANLREGRLVKGADVYGFTTLPEIIRFFTEKQYQVPITHQNIITPGEKNTFDFSDVNGQAFLKRAAEVAAAGMHNMLMVGSPGSGKTMISERMATILPPLTEKEQLEVSKIYSVCGMMSDSETLMKKRPFRSPHHTVSSAGMSGGGICLKPGEISLAHRGVLFLDELTEFAKTSLEILRQPLEDHRIRITRASGSVVYPADFLLLASMNPCNCGYYPDMQKCRCTPAARRRYFGKISQPLIDRIDICAEAPVVTYRELTGKGKNESSADIRERVLACHARQKKRFREENYGYNSRIPAIALKKYCKLGEKEQRYMEEMYQKLQLTARTYHKLIRVARTIADLDHAEMIRLKDLQEAVCYRSVDEKFWEETP